MTIADFMYECGIIPVIAIEKAEYSLPLGQALIDGGLPIAEITFRTEAALQAIDVIASTYPEIVTGAGSVLSIEQAKAAIDHGAKFIVSPGLNTHIVDWCLEGNIPVFPGVVTPSEIMLAVERGLSILKYFPAEVMGGLKVLKAVAAPFPGLKFIPTGGITAANLAAYLEMSVIHACGGSWLVDKKLMREDHFDEIERLVKEAVSIVSSVKDGHV
jgi:2-dehydro-3-deoxyphosphogluconate aldolase/(4S)-4-hydroxy-2-oxoglutarate aldolase